MFWSISSLNCEDDHGYTRNEEDFRCSQEARTNFETQMRLSIWMSAMKAAERKWPTELRSKTYSMGFSCMRRRRGRWRWLIDVMRDGGRWEVVAIIIVGGSLFNGAKFWLPAQLLLYPTARYDFDRLMTYTCFSYSILIGLFFIIMQINACFLHRKWLSALDDYRFDLNYYIAHRGQLDRAKRLKCLLEIFAEHLTI